MGTEARRWRSWSRRPHGERAARAEKHEVHLEVSHSHPTTTTGHPAGSYIFGCQRSRGTSLKQAEESSWQMQPASLGEQPCACCRGGLVIRVDQERLCRSCGHRPAGGSRQQRPAARRTQKEKARGDSKMGRLVNRLRGAAPAARAPGLAALAGCWSSSCCWIQPEEQGLNLLSSSAAHGQPGWAGTATHRCAQALCSAVG